MNEDTDLGPLVSLELNSLFPSSLDEWLASCSFKSLLGSALQDFVRKLWIIILLCKNMEEFRHGLGQMLEVGQTLYNRGLRS